MVEASASVHAVMVNIFSPKAQIVMPRKPVFMVYFFHNPPAVTTNVFSLFRRPGHNPGQAHGTGLGRTSQVHSHAITELHRAYLEGLYDGLQPKLLHKGLLDEIAFD